ncbi:MAG: VTT domain-containing protein [candidate division KSB1 bacterium]|nr:VTT domain-containing protein [candidate division KSB1 bacterium]MDZ7335230.1 VTT domain-containing protein [candidate division KSB1 bacterium]MDZ7376366.1 VTT domain-containing protein [candidate division KSB1 bacterium]MDZ7401415.1 VTT domain-containing protein [candidate division KSB1 bacterium]
MTFVRRLYDWVLHWAETPYGSLALIILAFAESSFFPVPPDVLLIALAISIPKRSFFYALETSIASVIGGMLGYYIGLALMDIIGWRIIDFYNARPLFTELFKTFNEYNFWAVLIAAITPIPYKVFTISAGAANANFAVFMIASIIGRSIRFFAVGALIFIFGERIKNFIDKYFNWLSIVFVVLLIGGFLLIKYAFR